MFAIAVLFAITFLQLQHGTAIAAVCSRDGCAMAADGLELAESKPRDGDAAFRTTIQESEPKIAICGERFICATAGINPILVIRAEYHFKDWIVSVKRKPNGTVRDFADAVQAQAKITFEQMTPILKTDEFWKSEISKASIFVLYQIIGYNPDSMPMVCRIYVHYDRPNRAIAYPEIGCKTPNLSSVSYHWPSFSHSDNMLKALSQTTVQSFFFSQFKRDAMIAVMRVIPDTPAPIQALVVNAATMIRVESEFEPQYVGGTTLVGIVSPGHAPILITLH
jgi:hypothetical protein